MTDINPSLREAFRNINQFQILFWRLGLGRWMSIWPAGIGTYMVINHNGRTSGKRYRTPVNFAVMDGEIYCVAGFGKSSDWYRNIVENPQVEIWHPDGWFAGTAEEIQVDSVTLPILRKIMTNSGFVARLMGLNPKTMSDEDLLAECKDYRLIHLRRTAPRTGRTGPGDLVWVWPVLLLLLLFRKRRKKCC